MIRRICFYLSDHGFGHIARSIPIIAKTVNYDDVHVCIVCGERQLAFAKDNLGELLTENLYNRVSFRVMYTDVGLILKAGTLLPDVEGLTKACEDFLEKLPMRVKCEVAWLQKEQVDAAFCDMPIWAILACKRANVPMLYAGNFTWAEIYRGLLPHDIFATYARCYEQIEYAILYALHNDEMLQFLPNAEKTEVSVVARPVHFNVVADIRQKHTRPIIFVALGMSAQFQVPVDVSDVPYDFYATEGVPLLGEHVTVIPASTTNTQDYIAAADFIISKAGWSTVAECLLAKKPMALFERDSVIEDKATIQKLQQIQLAIRIQQNDLMDIQNIIKRLNSLHTYGFTMFSDSSEVISRRMISLLDN